MKEPIFFVTDGFVNETFSYISFNTYLAALTAFFAAAVAVSVVFLADSTT